MVVTDSEGTRIVPDKARKPRIAVRYGDVGYLEGFFAHQDTDYMSYKFAKPGSAEEKDLADVIVYVEKRGTHD